MKGGTNSHVFRKLCCSLKEMGQRDRGRLELELCLGSILNTMPALLGLIPQLAAGSCVVPAAEQAHDMMPVMQHIMR